MESLLILVGIIALQIGAAWLKQRGKRNSTPHRENENEHDLPPDFEAEKYSDDDDDENSDVEINTPESLQELIRRFRAEQTKLDGEGNDIDIQVSSTTTTTSNGETKTESYTKTYSTKADKPETKAETNSAPENSSAEVFTAKAPEPETFTKQNFDYSTDFESESDFEIQDETTAAEISDSDLQSAHVSHSKIAFNPKEARKGFIWASILENPRFRRPISAYRMR